MCSFGIVQVCDQDLFHLKISICYFFSQILITSFRALMSTLGDFEFDSAQFESFVQPTFSSLFALLREAKECDTKMSVLTCMSLVVDKMGE